MGFGGVHESCWRPYMCEIVFAAFVPGRTSRIVAFGQGVSESFRHRFRHDASRPAARAELQKRLQELNEAELCGPYDVEARLAKSCPQYF